MGPIPLRANLVSDLFGEESVWLLLRLAVLSGAAFAAAWLATFLAMWVAFRPYYWSSATEWPERARLSWCGRRVGSMCLILVSAPIVAGAASTFARPGAFTGYLLAFWLSGVVWLGILLARLGFDRAIVPAHAETPHGARAQVLVGMMMFGAVLGIAFAAYAVESARILPVAMALAIGALLLSAFAIWGWHFVLRLIGVDYPASERLVNLITPISESMGIQPRSITEIALPMANAIAYPHLGRVSCTPSLLAILDDDQLAAVMAHELAHLSEPRRAIWTRIGRSIASACFLMAPGLLLFHRGSWISLVGLGVLLISLWFLKRSLVMSRQMEVRADEIARSHESVPGVYASALERISRENLIPVVMVAKNLTHPNLYDRLVAAGAAPDYPRPQPPPLFPARLGMAVSLILAVAAGFAIATLGSAPGPGDSVVRVILQEPGQLLEVRARLNEANHGDHRLGIDELLERDVVQVELARDRDEHAVEPILHECPIRSHAKLAPQHDVKGMRRSAPSLITKLNPVHSPLAAGSLLVFGLDELGQRRRELGLGQ